MGTRFSPSLPFTVSLCIHLRSPSRRASQGTAGGGRSGCAPIPTDRANACKRSYSPCAHARLAWSTDSTFPGVSALPCLARIRRVAGSTDGTFPDVSSDTRGRLGSRGAQMWCVRLAARGPGIAPTQRLPKVGALHSSPRARRSASGSGVGERAGRRVNSCMSCVAEFHDACNIMHAFCYRYGALLECVGRSQAHRRAGGICPIVHSFVGRR